MINDKPAVIYQNGTRLWYKNNLLHRDHDQPAIIYTNGQQQWYRNGHLCSESGAVV